MGRRKGDAPPTAEDLLKDKLILLIKEHPAIYDRKHPDHSNKNSIDQIWLNIGMQLNISGELVTIILIVGPVY
jgi:hypothetical protein